jgi:hypothetical protein
VQEKELQLHKEQEEKNGEAFPEEVLFLLQEPYGS